MQIVWPGERSRNVKNRSCWNASSRRPTSRKVATSTILVISLLLISMETLFFFLDHIIGRSERIMDRCSLTRRSHGFDLHGSCVGQNLIKLGIGGFKHLADAIANNGVHFYLFSAGQNELVVAAQGITVGSDQLTNSMYMICISYQMCLQSSKRLFSMS